VSNFNDNAWKTDLGTVMKQKIIENREKGMHARQLEIACELGTPANQIS
jgi:hypothetical protein